MLNKRRVIQIISLVIFLLLMAIGKIQLWMAIFLGGIVLSAVKGRIYCGFVCPINTVMEVIDDNAAKKGRRRLKTPSWAKNNFIRLAVLVLFVLTFLFIQRTGKRLPVLPALFIIGILLTLFWEPDFWHKYLCPYGTLFSLVSKKSKQGYTIADEGCIRCGKCVRACPANGINWDDKRVDPIINKHDCIVCGKCSKACSEKVINYSDNKVEYIP